jgi:hypothetical protein
MNLRVPPSAASSGFSGDQSSSCLESRILQRYLAAAIRVAPALRLVSAASRHRLRVAPSPASSGCRRRIFESPRISIPFSGTVGAAPGCPFAPPVSPLDPSAGCPARWIFRLRLGCLGGSPRFLSLGVADWRSSGSPRFSHRSACQRLISRVTPLLQSASCAVFASPGYPGSCSHGWTMMIPRFSRTEHPWPGQAVDESSNPIGCCTF